MPAVFAAVATLEPTSSASTNFDCLLDTSFLALPFTAMRLHLLCLLFACPCTPLAHLVLVHIFRPECFFTTHANRIAPAVDLNFPPACSPPCDGRGERALIVH